MCQEYLHQAACSAAFRRRDVCRVFQHPAGCSAACRRRGVNRGSNLAWTDACPPWEIAPIPAGCRG